MSEPKYIRARVTDESFDGWSAFKREYGVSISALVEALGPALGEAVVRDLEQLPVLREVVKRAREVDDDRRSR